MIPSSYDDIRRFIDEALRGREAEDVPDFMRPSDYWKFFAGHFQYVRSLPDWELQHIRRHTYHLTGDGYIRYLLHGKSFPRQLQEEYHELAAALNGFQAGEGLQGIGLEIGGRRVSVDLLRYLQVLRDLVDSHVFNRQAPVRILEIGGGYGGLASVVMDYNPAAAYIIIDLEETLFLQATHLVNRFGFESVELCDETLPSGDHLQPGRFYLVPQCRSAAIEGVQVDLAVNQQSMQEMNEPQIVYYCDLIGRAADYFYTCNLEQHPEAVVDRMGIVRSLSDLFKRTFPAVVWKSQSQRTRIKLLTKLTRPRRRLTDHALPRAVYACNSTIAERPSPTGRAA